MCLPQVIKSFQNYRGVATTFYPTLVCVCVCVYVYMYIYIYIQRSSACEAFSWSENSRSFMPAEVLLPCSTKPSS